MTHAWVCRLQPPSYRTTRTRQCTSMRAQLQVHYAAHQRQSRCYHTQTVLQAVSPAMPVSLVCQSYKEMQTLQAV